MKNVKLSLSHLKSTDHLKVSEKLLPVLIRKSKGEYFIPFKDKKKSRRVKKQALYEQLYNEHQKLLIKDLPNRRVVRTPKVLLQASSVLTQEEILTLIVLWSFRGRGPDGKRWAQGKVFNSTLLKSIWGKRWWKNSYGRLKSFGSSLKHFVRLTFTEARGNDTCGTVAFRFEEGWEVVMEGLITQDNRLASRTTDLPEVGQPTCSAGQPTDKTFQALRPACRDSQKRLIDIRKARKDLSRLCERGTYQVEKLHDEIQAAFEEMN